MKWINNLNFEINYSVRLFSVPFIVNTNIPYAIWPQQITLNPKPYYTKCYDKQTNKHAKETYEVDICFEY